MEVVPKADYEQLKALLEDTQASLAAALARIEAFRLREKILAQELAKLRIGGKAAETAAATDAVTQPVTAAPATQPTADGNSQTTQPPEQQCETSAKLPVYITELLDHVPVLLVSGGRQVSAFPLCIVTAGCSIGSQQDAVPTMLTRLGHYTINHTMIMHCEALPLQPVMYATSWCAVCAAVDAVDTRQCSCNRALH